jgi:hypothetical protein
LVTKLRLDESCERGCAYVQAGTLLMARFMAQTFDDNARGWYIRGTLLMNIAIGCGATASHVAGCGRVPLWSETGK